MSSICNILAGPSSVELLNKSLPHSYKFVEADIKPPSKPKMIKSIKKSFKKKRTKVDESIESDIENSSVLSVENSQIRADAQQTAKKLMYKKEMSEIMNNKEKEVVYKKIVGEINVLKSKSRDINTIDFFNEFNNDCLATIQNSSPNVGSKCIEAVNNFLISRTYNKLKHYKHEELKLSNAKCHEMCSLLESIKTLDEQTEQFERTQSKDHAEEVACI